MNTRKSKNSQNTKNPKAEPAKYLTVRLRISEDVGDALDTIMKSDTLSFSLERANWLRILLKEALFAIADQSEVDGYVAWQPRLNVDTSPGRRLSDGTVNRDCQCRYHDRLDRAERMRRQIDAVLKAADELAAKIPNSK